MAQATISYGSKLGLLNNAAISEVYYDQFRPFLRGVDALVQASVLSRMSTPPSSPSNGDAYIVLSGATGLWVGQTNNIAVYSSQITATGTNNLTPGWEFYTPKSGWIVYSVADALFYYVDAAGDWVSSLATSSVAGSVVPDDATIVVNGSGVISASTATNGTLGIVRPDNATIAISSGVLRTVPASIVIFNSSNTAFAGNFQFAHGLSFTPSYIVPVMTSDGHVWLQSTYVDATNIYLVASDAGISGIVLCFP